MVDRDDESRELDLGNISDGHRGKARYSFDIILQYGNIMSK